MRRRLVIQQLQDLKRASIAYFSHKNIKPLLAGFIGNTQWEETKKDIGKPVTLPQCAVDEWGFVAEGQARQHEIGQIQKGEPAKTPVQLAVAQHQPYVSSAHEFFQYVSNFLGQAVDLLCIRAVTGKSQKGVSSDSALQKLRDLGIHDIGPLSTNNLGVAFKALPTFQQEFRKRFGPLTDPEALTRLEREEDQLLWEIWALWYQLAFHAGQKMTIPVSMSTRKAGTALSRFRDTLHRNLRQQLKGEVNGKILSEEVLWEGKRALWVVFDIANPIELHTTFARVCEVLKASLSRQPDHKEIHRYALEFWWPETLIIPLVKGKALDKSAWRLLTASVWWGTAFDPSNVWSYIPRPIPEETWAQLRLSTWEDVCFEMVERLQETVCALSLIVAHICDLERLPDGNQVGQELLQSHVALQSQSIGLMHDQLVAVLSDILKDLKALPAEEIVARPALTVVTEYLAQLVKDIVLDTNEQTTLVMQMADMRHWLQKLELARAQVETIRLLWVTDVLRNMAHTSPTNGSFTTSTTSRAHL